MSQSRLAIFNTSDSPSQIPSVVLTGQSAQTAWQSIQDLCGLEAVNRCLGIEDQIVREWFVLEISGTLSDSVLRKPFHTYLVACGLSKNSANSYCAYMNNLCRNIAAAQTEGALPVNAFTMLHALATTNDNIDTFMAALDSPLAWKNGRRNDNASAAKQFFRFIKTGLKRGGA